MTMRRWTIVGVLAGLTLWACATLGATPGCPEARRHLQSRALAPAEVAARACLAAAPGEVAGWTVLAQVLAARGQYDEALTWYERVLVRFPADSEVAAARARTLAWSGRLDEAWRAVQALQPDGEAADAGVAVFAANLALWRSDFAEAQRRYDLVLARWPADRDALRGRAITRKTTGDLGGAHADFGALCQADPGSDNCAEADELAERRSWLRLRLGHGRTMSGSTSPTTRGPGWSLPAAADVSLSDQLRATVGAEHRVRDFGEGPVGDTFIETALSARLSPRWSLLAGAGATAARKFSPRWLGYVEPAAGVGGGAELFLRYTRYDFPAGGAHVLSPALRWEPAEWVMQGRYFLSLPDGEPARHAGLARLSRALDRSWSASIGAGGGGGLDYLEIREGATGRFWHVLATVSRRLTWRHQLTFEYVHRREQVAGDRHQQHQASIAGETRF